MAPPSPVPALVLLALLAAVAGAQELSPTYYADACPADVYDISRRVIQAARASDPRILASLVRLHFHDCFVSGCDGSLLLNESQAIRSEKNAAPNLNSLQGYPVVDDIKKALEEACPGVVSCADILALAAEISVQLAGGPSWSVMLGRKDATTANFDGANNYLPRTSEPLEVLRKKFAVLGLNDIDFVALQGAHTIGRAQCKFVGDRLTESCPAGADTDLDPYTPYSFDNSYYVNIMSNCGLLQSDQAMHPSPGSADAPFSSPIVKQFASSEAYFFNSFAEAMIRMGNIAPLTGDVGEDREVRTYCNQVNRS